ncbi:MAG: periplasmic heavy metal sensor, partial [Candidatus Acidiferrum sp.]
MKISSKLGLAALALALSCGPMVAQGSPQDPPADEPDGGGVFGPGPGGPGEMLFGLEGPGDEVNPGAEGPRRDMGPGPAGMRGGGRERGGFERWGHGRGRHEFSLGRLLSDPEIQQKVGITADQVAKIRQQESAFRKNEIRQRADLEVQQIDLRDLLSAQTPDRAAIDAKLQQVGAARLAMEKARIDFRLNMKDALTADQRAKLRQALRDRWQARRGNNERRQGARGQRGPGGGSGQGPA